MGDGSKKRKRKIMKLADQLLLQVENSIAELDQHEQTVVRKEKQVFFDNPDAPNRATGEVTSETKHILRKEGLIDRDGIKKLTAALKELQSILAEENTERPAIQVLLDEELKEYGS